MKKPLTGAVMLAAGAAVGSVAEAAEAKRKITNIAGDLHRFRNNLHFPVFPVTPAGVIAADPINAEAAGWLKAEITKRFNKDIKYLIHSHDHSGHIAGGEACAGKSLDDIRTSLTLDKYKDWGQYAAWRAMNIEGARARINPHGRAR